MNIITKDYVANRMYNAVMFHTYGRIYPGDTTAINGSAIIPYNVHPIRCHIGFTLCCYELFMLRSYVELYVFTVQGLSCHVTLSNTTKLVCLCSKCYIVTYSVYCTYNDTLIKRDNPSNYNITLRYNNSKYCYAVAKCHHVSMVLIILLSNIKALYGVLMP